MNVELSGVRESVESLRERGAVRRQFDSAEAANAWRAAMRRACRAEHLRIRTFTGPERGDNGLRRPTVHVVHVDHATTEADLIRMSEALEALPVPVRPSSTASDRSNRYVSDHQHGIDSKPFPVSDAEWQAIELRRFGSAGQPAGTSSRDGGGGLEESHRPSHHGLAWTREEDILALDLFVCAGVVNGGSFLSETDPRVIALSDELRALPTRPGVARDERFRNPAGVALKLMNFRAAEKATKMDIGVPGADALPGGMRRYSALDRAIFEEYYRQGFQGLAEDAQAVRGASGLGGITAATRAQDPMPLSLS